LVSDSRQIVVLPAAVLSSSKSYFHLVNWLLLFEIQNSFKTSLCYLCLIKCDFQKYFFESLEVQL
jgi:hypothetical protein